MRPGKEIDLLLAIRAKARAAVLASYPTDTASGSAASFPDGADGVPVKDLKVSIQPVQDLHGYDHPWPAGGGKNKFDKTAITDSYYLDADGNLVSNTSWSVSDYIGLSGTITISGYGDSGLSPRSCWYDANKLFISSFQLPQDTFTVAVPSGAVYARFSVRPNNVDTIQIELGSSATSYAPYANICPISGWTALTLYHSGEDTTNPETLPISWQTEAGTVYGGTLDVTTGELSVTHASVSFADISWVRYTNTVSGNSIFYEDGPRDMLYIDSGVSQPDLRCSAFPVVRTNARSTLSGASPMADQSITYLVDSENMTDRFAVRWEAKETVSDFVAAVSGVTAVYPIAAPITYQLTPTQVKTLLGDNNIWADCGGVELEYRADLEKYIEKKIGEGDAGTLSLGAAPSVIRPGVGLEMQPLGLDDAGVDYINELPDADEYLGDLEDEPEEDAEEEDTEEEELTEEPEEETDDDETGE